MKRKIIIWISVAVVLLLVILLIANEIESTAEENKKIQEQETAEYYDWLVDSCECVEKERRICLEGFELSEDEKICVGNKRWTSVRIKCSQFNCSDEIVNWNFENEIWELKLEIN